MKIRLLLLALFVSFPLSAQLADLAVTKTGPAEASAGSDVTYDVTLQNLGGVAAANVTLTDVVPPEMSFVAAFAAPGFACGESGGTITCTAPSLAAGATAVFQFVLRIDNDAPPGSIITNTASATTATPESDGGNNSGSASTEVMSEADLLVEKSAPAQAAPGTDVTYTVTVRNLGPHTAGGVTLTDPIPAGMTFVSHTAPPGFSCTTPAPGSGGTISCSGALLAAGSTATFTFVVHIAPSTPLGTTFTNRATAATETFDVNEENNTGIADTSTAPPPTGDLRVMKSGPSVAPPGGNVTFTITLANNGPNAAATVSLQDTLPAPMTFVSLQQSGTALSCTTPAVGAGGTITCTSASYPAAASTTLTLTANIPAGTQGGTELTNTATVTSTNDPNEENNAATTTVIVSSVDMSVVKSGPATATAGTNIAYTITVANAGPDPASEVTLIDAIPPGTTFVSFTHNSGVAPNACTTTGTITCTFGVFPAGASSQFTLTLNTGTATTINNTATVTTESFDTDGSDNSSTAVTTVAQSADLVVSKTAPLSVVAGTNLSYTINLLNSGPSNAVNVSVTDVLPPNTTFVSAVQTAGPAFTCGHASGTITCTIGVLVPGVVATFEFVVSVAPTATGAITNTVQAASATPDPSGGNNQATSVTTVSSSADLGVTKTAPAGVLAGTNLTFTVTASNAGPSTAANVALTDVLPANTTFVSATQTGGPAFSCVHAAGTITCTTASLAPAAMATFNFVVSVAANATGTISNTAQITSGTPDPAPGNNSSTSVTTIGTGADLIVTKSAPAAIVAGNNLTFTVSASNAGPSTAVNVSLTDAVPANTTFVSATQTSGPAFTCGHASGTITCTVASLAPAAAATFDFVVSVPAAATGAVSNTAQIASATPDPAPGNNSATTTTAITPAPADVAITKTVNGQTFVPGAPAVFTIVVTNAGPGPATNTVVTDVLPAGATLTGASSTQGTCSGTATVTCTLGTLPANESATITLNVNLPLAQGTVTNTATVTSDTDPAAANNTSTATITIAAVPAIPTLSPAMLALLAIALGAVVVWRR